MRNPNLDDFRAGRIALNQAHLNSLKALIGNGVRAQWKKQRLNSMTLSTLRLRPDHWSFRRIEFTPDGRCEYTAGQDYTYEIRQVQEAILGKKPN